MVTDAHSKPDRGRQLRDLCSLASAEGLEAEVSAVLERHHGSSCLFVDLFTEEVLLTQVHIYSLLHISGLLYQRLLKPQQEPPH